MSLGCKNGLTLVNPVIALMIMTSQTCTFDASGIMMVNPPAQRVEIKVTIIAPNLSDK